MGFGPANDSSAGKQIFEIKKKWKKWIRRKKRATFSFLFIRFFFFLFFTCLKKKKKFLFFFSKPVYWLKAPFRNSRGIFILCAWEKKGAFLFFSRGRNLNFLLFFFDWVCSEWFNQSVRSRGMSPVRVNIFFFILFFSQREAIFFEKRKWRKNLIFGSRRHIFESHWRRRREQKIVLKAGFFFMPCESPARYANVSFSGGGIKAKEKKRKQFFFFLLSNFFILIHGVPIFFFVLREKAIFFWGGGNECEGRQVAIVTWLIGAVRD